MQTRNTIQKDIILKAVHRLHNHPTAEMVYEEVIKEHPTISKATVYRNLNQMAEQGSVLRVRISNSADRYDFNCQDHYHFKCRQCGMLHDVNFSHLPTVKEIKLKEQGFILEDYQIIFQGICPECNKIS